MLIYFLIFPIIGIFYLVSIMQINGNSIVGRKSFLSLSFAFLSLVAVFRAPTVGADVKTYEFLFVQLLSGRSTGEGNTPIYNVYSEIIGKISSQPVAITVANSVVICILVAIFIYRSEVNAFYATLLYVAMYFYADGLNGARQYIAIGLVLNAFLFLLNKSWKWYIVLTVVAIGIHSTAIVSLIYVPIVLIKWNLKKSIIFFSILVTIGLLYSKIISFFVLLFPRYTFYLTGNGYTGVQTIDTLSQGKILYYYLFLLTMFLLIMFLIKKYRVQLTGSEAKIAICYGISIFIGSLFFKVILMQRIMWYFAIFGVVFFPLMSDKISKILRGGKRDSSVLFVFFFVVIFVVYIIRLQNNYDMIVPYTTWL